MPLHNTDLVRLFLAALVTAVIGGCGGAVPSVTVVPREVTSQSILIKDVTVFDSVSLQTRPHMDVTITGSRISALTPTGPVQADTDRLVIAGQGATLLPGLIDMHGHLTTTTGPSWEFSLPNPEANLLAYVYAGVTTIFDPSDTSDEAYSRRQKVALGELTGPQIYTAGRILTHPQGHPRALVNQLAPWWIKWYLRPRVATGIDTPGQAIAAVNERADAGADAIKIVVDSIPLQAPKLRPEIIKAIVSQADSRGIRTVAHVGTTEDAITAADSGVAMWVHGVYEERIADEMIAQLVDYGIPMVTTSEVFDRYGRAVDGPIVPTPLEREIVPGSVLESFYPIPADFDPGPLTSWVELMQGTIQTRLDNVGRLHAAGMTIFAGSDVQSGVFPGASLHRELANMVAAGMSPAEVIHAATLAPARYLANGQEPDFGVIAVGKRADLILVEGNPSTDINALAKLREVFLNGVPLDRSSVVE